MVVALAVQASIPLAALVATDRGFAWRRTFAMAYGAALAAIAALAVGTDAIAETILRVGPVYESCAAYGMF